MKNPVFEQIQARKVKSWEAVYNEDRPHLALKGKTSAERVRELVKPFKACKGSFLTNTLVSFELVPSSTVQIGWEGKL